MDALVETTLDDDMFADPIPTLKAELETALVVAKVDAATAYLDADTDKLLACAINA
jgi:hypothetical protein